MKIEKENTEIHLEPGISETGDKLFDAILKEMREHGDIWPTARIVQGGPLIQKGKVLIDNRENSL